jgi:hypothetical protein
MPLKEAWIPASAGMTARERLARFHVNWRARFGQPDRGECKPMVEKPNISITMGTFSI